MIVDKILGKIEIVICWKNFLSIDIYVFNCGFYWDVFEVSGFICKWNLDFMFLKKFEFNLFIFIIIFVKNIYLFIKVFNLIRDYLFGWILFGLFEVLFCFLKWNCNFFKVF